MTTQAIIEAPLPALPDGPANHTVLPLDLATQREVLIHVIHRCEALKRNADGLFFGMIGLDALAGLIPLVGAVYSGGMGFALMTQAFRARVGIGTKLFGGGMMALDIAVGFVPGTGDLADAVLRNHAFFANSIMHVAQDKVRMITALQTRLQDQGSLLDHEVEHARRHVFRAGSSEAGSYVRLALIAMLCGGLLYSCHHQQTQRQATIQSCVEQGGWFCQLLY